MTDEMLVERLRHCIAHPVYTHSQCEDALIAEAADRLSALEEEKRAYLSTLDEIAHASWPSVNGDDPVRRIQDFAKRVLKHPLHTPMMENRAPASE